MKIKDVLNFIPDESLQSDLKRMKRAKDMVTFQEELQRMKQV